MEFCTSLKDQSWSIDTKSLYLLYGHMLEPSLLKVGEVVTSGETIGKVGTTGMSVNAHLHLEMRWGPGGTEFASMNYYNTGATQQEMDNYCEWRISGKYVLLDPMIFFNDWLSLSSKTN
jgi:murein DD-endopeptidase MepM/ murein hydrolase activator NlpD